MYIYLEREKFLERIEKKRRRIFRWSKNISRKWNCAKACLLIASIDKTTAIGAALAENGMEIRESWISASCLRPLLHTLWKKTCVSCMHHTRVCLSVLRALSLLPYPLRACTYLVFPLLSFFFFSSFSLRIREESLATSRRIQSVGLRPFKLKPEKIKVISQERMTIKLLCII